MTQQAVAVTEDTRPLGAGMQLLLWVVWAGTLFGGFSFTFVIAQIFANPSTQPPADAHEIKLLFIISLFFGVFSVAISHGAKYLVLNRVIRRKSWRGMRIAYPICKLVAWFMVDGVVFFNLIICLITHSFLPTLPLAAIAWLVIAADPPLLWPFRRLKEGRSGAGLCL